MTLTREARVVADRLVTAEWQSTSELWEQARGAATWGTFLQVLRNMVIEGTLERRQADRARAVFYRRAEVPEGGKVNRRATEEERMVLGLLSLEPITVLDVFDLVRKRELPIRTVDQVRGCLRAALHFGWAIKHDPKPTRYSVTRAGETELDEAQP